MLKKILGEIGEFLISPVLYILVLGFAGTGFIFNGVLLMFGEGAAFITVGGLLLVYTVALIRSVNGG